MAVRFMSTRPKRISGLRAVLRRPSALHWATAALTPKGRSPDSRLMVAWLTP